MINSFDGEFAFLSNFYDSPISDGRMIMPTVEHYFQAAKADSMYDYIAIATAATPGQAKRAGRKAALRHDWEDVKMNVMREALRKKFSDPELKAKLLATGDQHLEEGNTWHDNFWGVCHCDRCQDIMAHNHLGKLLMELRTELMEDK